MHRKVLPIIAVFFLLFSIFNSSCNKLDTTDIGSGLIPPVDNVSTFETNLLVNSTQAIFNDSTILSPSDDYVLGSITDPIFGKTTASIFLELKPTVYPYYWGGAGDTVKGSSGVGLDSMVLCLSYKGFYGDSATPQKLKVYAISNTVTTFKDSGYKIGSYYPALGQLLGTAIIDPSKLRNWTVFTNKKDSAQNQVRIKLDEVSAAAFLNQLYQSDSTSGNAFFNDSTFRSKYKGFAIVADTNSTAPGGLFYCNLVQENTRLEVHFRKRRAGVTDTIFNSLRFNNTTSNVVAYSAAANYVRRGRQGSEFDPPVQPGFSTAIYIQTTPGSYAELTIPGLDTLSNRIIHRAELILEQVYDNPLYYALSNKLVPPSFLFLDAIDTTSTTPKWKPIPFDLNTNENYAFYPIQSGIDFAYFGGYLRHKADPNNPVINMAYYNFNLSRYVQHIVTNHNINHKLRLYAPFQLNYPQFLTAPIGFSNSLAFGRVKLGSGSNPNYRMRLHIVYSKI